MSGAREPPPAAGRISFRIRIGVTGHRELEVTEELRAALRQQIARIQDELLPAPGGDPPTRIRLTIVSPLAEGADRLVVDEVFAHALERGQNAHLEVILPMETDAYIESQHFSGASLEEFNRLLAGAESTFEPPETLDVENHDLYELGGRRVVGRCDVLIAIWDGAAPQGKGGTADTLLHAAGRGRPCIWIRPGEHPVVSDNLSAGGGEPFYRDVSTRARPGAVPDARALPHAVLSALRETHEGLHELNRDRISEADLRRSHELRRDEDRAWVTDPFLRASLLARRKQRRFMALARAISTFAILGAVALGLNQSGIWSGGLTRWLEPLSVVFALVAFFWIRRGQYHRRWLTYRLLAERLRAAYYLAPTGVDFRRTAGLDGVFVERHSEDWLQRAVDEVWSHRPPVPDEAFTDEQLDDLKALVADEWIDGQIGFHQKKERFHERWDATLKWVAVASFVVALFFSFAGAFGAEWHEVPTLLSIALPAVAAAFGVLATVGQHHALSERYRRMKTDLVIPRDAVRHAKSQEVLRAASFDAARIIAQETGDWLGAMWFLDIEHL